MAKSDTTTQTSAPWKPTQSYYKDLYKKAYGAFEQVNNKPYTGDLYAGPTAAQLQAAQGVKDASGAMGTGVDELRQLATSQLRGDWLNPDSNPFIRSVVDASLRPVQQGFDANRLAITDKAIAQGAYGGSRQDLQQERALDDYVRSAGDISSSIYGANYANERQIQQNSAGLLDKANLLSLAGPTALAAAGSQEQGWNQAELNAMLKKWQMDQQAPFAGMSELASILGAGGFGTTTKTTPSDPLLGALQGIMGGATTGAGLATGIGGVAAGAGLSAFAPWMLPFAALGGLAGAL